MTLLTTGVLGLMMVAATVAGHPGTSLVDDIEANLARMPQPWVKKLERLSLEEYVGTIAYWAKKYPTRLTARQWESSAKQLPVYLLKITDSGISDEDKQVALITVVHGGAERSGTTTALRLAEWLLGESEAAQEIRRKQVVLIMPMLNPHGFFVSNVSLNAHAIDLYYGGGMWDANTLTFKSLDKAPELAALLSVVDEFKPEVQADLHGTGVQSYLGSLRDTGSMFEGQTMYESTAGSGANPGIRPWDPRVTEMMVAAGRQLGYPSDRLEADAQRIMGADAYVKGELRNQTAVGRFLFYTAHYSYFKYHTMISTSEIGWEESGVARIRGLLGIGNRVWDGEPNVGYPVNRMVYTYGHFVLAHGATAAQRRRSRVELWSKQKAFKCGFLYPEVDGRQTYFVATSAKAAAVLSANRNEFITNVKTYLGARAETIVKYIQNGPEVQLSIFDSVGYPYNPAIGAGRPLEQIENGISFRVRIPNVRPTLLDLRLNGELLRESATDGYQSWLGDGYTMVQVNVPPEKSRVTDLFLVTCAYHPNEVRTYGFEPPADVKEEIRSRLKAQERK